MIWEYIFDWPTNQPCYQTNGNIYWVSLSADCFDTNLYQFGWKTTPTNWNDDAVYGDGPFGGPPTFWAPLVRPGTTNSLDLAIEIYTATNPPSPVPPPTPTNAIDKWLQLPNTTTSGMDIKATDPKILADDFFCTNTGPITQIRIWGSWRNDMLPPTPPCFCLGIWSDAPAVPGFPSHPLALLCSNCFNQCNYTFFPYTNCVNEQFYDPNTGLFTGADTTIWEYIFNWPTNMPCIQTNGNIYWLSLTADCMDTISYNFGWKTSRTNWNDDAVWGDVGPWPNPLLNWRDLRNPFNTNLSLDLSFEIITGTNGCPPPGIVCVTNKTVQCGTSWPIDVPTVITNCCSNNYILTLNSVTNGLCPQIIVFTWKVADCLGQISSCSQTVTVVDLVPPVLTCAPNKTVQCGTNWNFDPPTAFDQCCGTNVTVTVLSTVTNSACQAIRTWQAADCCSNSINCSQIVTINDTNRPTIICPSNITVITCCSNVAVSWSIIATDACTSVTGTSSPPSGSLFNRNSTNTVVATATDACGNTNSCSFQVIVLRPTLSIGVGLGTPPTNVIITWVTNCGTLEDATNILGPWTARPLATSPHTNDIISVQRFFRLRCP